MQTAFFRFHGALNDFLSPALNHKPIKYNFRNNPSVKDAIEALGVPHVEIDFILINNLQADFSCKLNDNDSIDVYPLNENSSISQNPPLIPRYSYPMAFIADVNLGKLAKALRILGIDTAYQNHFEDKKVVDLAEKENRIILTRDIGLLKHKAIKWGYWLRSQHVDQQIVEVIKRFDLSTTIMPFKRCIVCNGHIETVAKEAVLVNLPPKTINFFNEYFQCAFCKRIYWKGSHYENMLTWLNQLKEADLKNNN